jgi:hypothetical protein
MIAHEVIVPPGNIHADARLELVRLLTAAGFQIKFLFIGRRKGQGVWHAYHGEEGCIIGRSMAGSCIQSGFVMKPIAGEHWDAKVRKAAPASIKFKLPEPNQPSLPQLPLLTALEFYRAELYRCGMLADSDNNRVLRRLTKEAEYYV